MGHPRSPERLHCGRLGGMKLSFGALVTCVALSGCGGTDEAGDIEPLVDFGSSNAFPQATSLALDADHIYVSAPDGDLGFIQRLPKTGGPAEQLAELPQRTMQVAVDDSHVYFTDMAGGPRAVSKLGGEVVYIGGGGGGIVWTVAVDATRVYWTRWPGSATGSIESAAKDGTDLQVLSTSESLGLRLVVDDSHVFWGDQAGQVWAIPKQGGEAVRLAAESKLADHLALDETYVYFTSGGIPDGDGRVSRVPKTGGEAQALAEIDGYPQGIAVDSGRLYVGTQEGIVSMATDGTDRRLLPGTRSVGNELDNDGEAIYWVSDSGGVYRLAR